MKILFISPSFNPSRFKKPVRNLMAFAENFPESCELKIYQVLMNGQQGSAERKFIYKSFRTDSIIWHKEKTINFAIKEAEFLYDAIFWVDADIIVQDEAFLKKCEDAIKKYDVVQGFSKCHLLDKEETDMFFETGKIVGHGPAIDGVIYNYFGQNKHPGLIWGARTDWLNKVGSLFDWGILGGGDSFFLEALMGITTELPFLKKVHGKYVHRVRDSNPKIGYVKTDKVFHLEHGSIENRKYGNRYDIVTKNNYKPDSDLKVQAGPTHEWTSSVNHEFKEEVKQYFLDRKEDE